MIRGFYTARTALNAHQTHMDTIANNMANVNTVGFKPMRTAFKDLMYQNLNREAVENEVMVGHGVKVNKNDVHMAQGSLEMTDYPFDYAIVAGENAFFAVQDDMGQIFYTRAGDFRLSNDDDTWYLVTGNGERVLDMDGEEIEVEFDENGNIDFDYGVIGVFRFQNHYGLSLAGDNRFYATELSGDAMEFEDYDDSRMLLKPGYIEGSGVEIAKEMADVVTASKAFSFASRMVQVADEVEQTVNNLR